MKARPVGTELFHADGPTGIKLIIVFRLNEGSQLTVFTELNLVSHISKERSSEQWMRRMFGSKRKKVRED
jgi:hypothetical protein